MKRLLLFVLGAGYASGWWAACLFIHEAPALVVVPVVSTLVFFIVMVVFFVERWNER